MSIGNIELEPGGVYLLQFANYKHQPPTKKALVKFRYLDIDSSNIFFPLWANESIYCCEDSIRYYKAADEIFWDTRSGPIDAGYIISITKINDLDNTTELLRTLYGPSKVLY